jgi:hypothetical protein
MGKKQMSKYNKLISIFFILLMIQACADLSKVQITKENTQLGGRKLQDISVFHEYGSYREHGVDAPVFCVTWGNFELENGLIPLDKTISNEGKKVYRVNARASGGLMFPLHGWGAFSLEQYYPNGCIEFDILGAIGGEDLSIGLRSDTKGIAKTHSISLSSQNIKVTNSWQHIKIPIKDIVGRLNDGFSINDITIVILDIPKIQKFYLSEMYITSPDNEKQYPVVKVNQTGYRLHHAKYALVSCFPDTLGLSEQTEFKVIDKNNETRFTGKLQMITELDPSSGERVFSADFTGFNEPGEYYIKVICPGVEDSFKFSIGDTVYDGLFVDAMRFFYYQRQGIDLEKQYAGVFARKNLHPGDSNVKKLSERTNDNAPVYDISQGWYDAGDYGKYFYQAASTVGSLLFAYELFPNLFTDNQSNIPESGNGVPDLLDEIKWELDMLLKMEDGTTGGFYGVANYSNSGGKETIYIIDTNGEGGAGNTKSTAATALASGVFAHAYIVYKEMPQYAAFARKCLETAQRAWKYLEANPGNSWVYGADRSYYYSQNEVNMLQFQAAATLYRATGARQYQDYVLETYQGFDYARQFNPNQIITIGALGKGFVHYAMCPNPNATVINFFDNKFTIFQRGLLINYRTKAWPTVLPDWAYYWSCNDPLCRIPAELYLCNKVLKKDISISVQLARESIHYILGINPLSFSFVSGYGENCVKNIHSDIYIYDGIDEMPRGYMTGGANQYNAGFMSNYVSKCYVDSDMEWTTNEHEIYGNSALVFCLAVVLGTADMKTGSKFTEAQQ